MSVTPNAITRLYNEDKTGDFKPVVQVIDFKVIRQSTGGSGDRYRIILSDGKNYLQAMLATQLNDIILSNQLEKFGIVRLSDYITNIVQNRKLIIVLDLEIIQVTVGSKIGNPLPVEGGVKSTSTSSADSNTSTARQTNPPPQNPYQSNASTSSNPLPSSYSNLSNPYQAMKENTGYQSNRKPVVRDETDVKIFPISSLNPYPSRWTIKARVTSRADIRTWSNSRGEGKLFSVDLLDSENGEIRATMFNESCDKFYHLLEPGKVFYMSGGKVKMANKKFSSIKNDYEITFDEKSDIRLAPEDASIQSLSYNFKSISQLENLPIDDHVDVLGVVKTVGELQEFQSRAGKDIIKRDFSIVDDSLSEVKVTLWGEKAKTMDISGWVDSIVAVKGAKLSEYNGRALNTYNSSMLVQNPDVPQAGRLYNWYHNGGSKSQVKTLSGGTQGGALGNVGTFEDRVSIADIKTQQLGFKDKADYVTIKGVINMIKHDGNISYQACPECQKKVIQDSNGSFSCEKCQRHYDSYQNRYILNLCVCDFSGSCWVTAFNDQGTILLGGKTADEVVDLQLNNTPAFDSCIKNATFQEYKMKLRVKAEPVQGDTRVKQTIVTLQPIDYVAESRDLIQAIEKYL